MGIGFSLRQWLVRFAFAGLALGGWLAAASFAVPSVAHAQQSPTLTATPVAPSVWRISGAGFTPGEQLGVLEVPCALPCGAGPQAYAPATVGPDGSFSVDLDFTRAVLPPGRDSWVVAAWPPGRRGLASDPTVRFPATPTLAGTLGMSKQLYVIGDDASAAFEGQITGCAAGTGVSVGFYKKGPGSSDNVLVEGLPTTNVVVAADGAIRGAIPFTAGAPARPATVFAAVSGGCLPSPLFATGGAVLLAIRDADENRDGASTIVVPADALNSRGSMAGGKTLAEAVGSIEVLANGRLCTEASLVAPGTLDAEGNARIHIGGPAQPGECSLAGALITFINGSGQTLFEKRTLIPGVTQPLENLAPEAAPNTGPVPGAPAAGSGSSLAPAATGGGQRMAALGVAALAAFALVAMQLARRRRRTR